MIDSRAKPSAVTALRAIADPVAAAVGNRGRRPGEASARGTRLLVPQRHDVCGQRRRLYGARAKHGFSQSFRAVWDVGNWDAGGITIPQGESGRPGSGHYTDEAADWVAGRLLALPYSNSAVDRAAVDRLTLAP